ncbi:hypothetical protein [Xanthobacter flavus]|uniref:hypothetical protein n=1 Tax=Xanthobacter flavus TaxID=281 RepID=UPI0032AEA9EF
MTFRVTGDRAHADGADLAQALVERIGGDERLVQHHAFGTAVEGARQAGHDDLAEGDGGRRVRLEIGDRLQLGAGEGFEVVGLPCD